MGREQPCEEGYQQKDVHSTAAFLSSQLNDEVVDQHSQI